MASSGSMSVKGLTVKQAILRILFPFKGEMIPSLYYKYFWQGIFISMFLQIAFFSIIAGIPGGYPRPEGLLGTLGEIVIAFVWPTLAAWFYPYVTFVASNPCTKSIGRGRGEYAILFWMVLFVLVHSVLFLVSPVLGVVVYRKSRKRRIAKELLAQGSVTKSVVLRDIEENDPDALEEAARINSRTGRRYIRRDPNRFNT